MEFLESFRWRIYGNLEANLMKIDRFWADIFDGFLLEIVVIFMRVSGLKKLEFVELLNLYSF
jgi:hypothetical protein